MPKKTHVQTEINGEGVEFLCEPRQSLLEVLRDELHLTGAKEGCNNGNCGACTVRLGDRIVNSCIVLGVEAEGQKIETIEGIATSEGLHPIQQKFLEHAALQCGICTPGFIVSSKALLEQKLHFKQMGQSGREYVAENFSKEACVSQIESMLRA